MVFRRDKIMYLGYQQGKIKFYTDEKLDTTRYNLEKVEETQDEYVLSDDSSEYVLKDKAWEQKQKEKERERINMLSLTGADVERALYLSRKIDFEDVIFLVEQYNKRIDDKKQEYLEELEKYNSLEDEQKQEAQEPIEPKEEPIDIKALKIELKANNFFRGNPFIEQIGALLGYSSDDLDYLFQNKQLPEKEEPEPTETEAVEE